MLARPGLPSFEYVRPSTASEVCSLLSDEGSAAQLMAGGTDLLPRMRDGLARPALVVDVKGVPGLRQLSFDATEGLRVGAAVHLNALASDAEVRARYPLLVEAATSIASYQVRNRATLGGNLCNASPAADTAPAALCLDAEAILCSLGGHRTVPLGEFFLGPGRTVIAPGEFLVAVRFPVPQASGFGRYIKLGRNKAGDLAIVGVAIFGWRDTERGPGTYRYRIGLASVAPVPMRAYAAEEAMAHNPTTDGWLCAAAEMASEAASPIDDVRGSAAYRREMVRNLALRGLREVTARLRSGLGSLEDTSSRRGP